MGQFLAQTSTISIYTLPISDIVKKHKVQHCMLYADDGHLYLCFKPTDANVTRIHMETLEAAKTMVHTLVTSKLDYCNNLLYGLPDLTQQDVECAENG